MIAKEDIRKAASYYINNDVTLEDAALYVGIKSKKTLNNYFARLCSEKWASISVESNIISEATLYLQKCSNKRDFKT